MMEKYGVAVVRPWLEQLRNVDECGVIVAFPMAGINRVLSDIPIENYRAIDASIFGDSAKDVMDYIDGNIEKVVRIGGRFLVVTDIDFENKNIELYLKCLHAVRLGCGKKVNYIFRVFVDPKFLCEEVLVKYQELVGNNILYFPWADGNDFELLVEQNLARFGIQVTDDQKNRIFQLSGGCPYLVKNLFKRLVENKGLEIDQEMIGWGLAILRMVSPRWRVWLADLSALIEERRTYLEKLRIIDKNRIRSEILREAVKIDDRRIDLGLVGNELLLGGRKITDELSPSEKEVLKQLIARERLSREEVARAYWGEKKAGDYSEYALDKLMSKLRKKLVRLGVSGDYLLTLKGFGYRINVGSKKN